MSIPGGDYGHSIGTNPIRGGEREYFSSVDTQLSKVDDREDGVCPRHDSVSYRCETDGGRKRVSGLDTSLHKGGGSARQKQDHGETSIVTMIHPPLAT